MRCNPSRGRNQDPIGSDRRERVTGRLIQKNSGRVEAGTTESKARSRGICLAFLFGAGTPGRRSVDPAVRGAMSAGMDSDSRKARDSRIDAIGQKAAITGGFLGGRSLSLMRQSRHFCLVGGRTALSSYFNLNPTDLPVIVPGHVHMLCDRHKPKRHATPQHPDSSSILIGGSGKMLISRPRTSRR